MISTHTATRRIALAIVTLAAGSGTGALAQTMAGQSWIVGLPCDQVSTQAVIDNVPQQMIGIACRQPDNRWQFLEVAPAGVTLFGMPAGYGDPMQPPQPPQYQPPVPFGLQSPFGFGDWLRESPRRSLRPPMYGTPGIRSKNKPTQKAEPK